MDVISVHGKVITDRDIDRAMIRYLVQLEEDERSFEPTQENLKYLRVEASNTLISRLLLLECAKRNGCVVSDEDLDEEMAYIRSQFESRENWEKNLMLFQLTEEDVREEVRGDMLIEQLLEKEGEKEPISDSTVKSFYEMNAQFLKEPTLYSFYEISAKNQEMVHRIITLLRSGHDIVELESAVGEMGETFLHHTDVVEGSIPEEVRQVLRDLEIQGIGTMVLPDGGFVVYKLLARVEGKQRSLENLKKDLKQYLEKEKRTKIYQRILDEEMDQADIKYLHVEYFEKR